MIIETDRLFLREMTCDDFNALYTGSAVRNGPRILNSNNVCYCMSVRCAENRSHSLVIAVRVSGGHLCGAEAPTEPAGETAARCVAIRSLLRGIRILSCFALRMTRRSSLRTLSGVWQSVFPI